MKILNILNIVIAIVFSAVHLTGDLFLSNNTLNSNAFSYALAIMAGFLIAGMMFEKLKLYIAAKIGIRSVLFAICVMIINIMAFRANDSLFFISMFPVYLLSMMGRFIGDKIFKDNVAIKDVSRFKRGGALFGVLSVGVFYTSLVFVEPFMIIILAVNMCRAILLLWLDIKEEKRINISKQNDGKQEESSEMIENNVYSQFSISNILYANALIMIYIAYGFLLFSLFLGIFVTAGMILANFHLILSMFVINIILSIILAWPFIRILQKRAGIPTYIAFGIIIIMFAIRNPLYIMSGAIASLLYLTANGYFKNN